MRNLESNNAQSVEIGVEMEQPENEWNQGGKVSQFPFPGPVAPCFKICSLMKETVSIGSHINYQLIRRTLGFRA